MSSVEIKGMEQFDAQVMKARVPTLVDFWAAWCGPCKAYSPVIEDIAKEYDGKIKLVKVNVDENEELSSKYGISSIPTTFLVEDGKIKASTVGAMPKPMLKKWLDENL